ncbi:MAG: hypothetical protein AAFP10_01715 [Pseudomonadota bacterium]
MLTDPQIPLSSISAYRLDLYRLLTLLLADKQIASDPLFCTLGQHHFDHEVDRLLILIAAMTRRLLDNTGSTIRRSVCGRFWRHYPKQQKTYDLDLHHACSMIIHASNIVTKSFDYYYHYEDQLSITKKEAYFEDTIIITGEKKQRAEMDVKAFFHHCIELSHEITGDDPPCQPTEIPSNTN